VVFPVDWNGRVAFDAVGPVEAVDALAAECDVPVVDADAYEAARIEAGVPRQGLDTDDRTIPQEAGLEATALSFTKGCFVGQELVCRIDTRGHVNRYLRRLRSNAGELRAGARVTAGDREVGDVTSAAGTVALAMLRREVEPAAVVDVAGVAATVEAL
jgi:folate-binding protein YgfZ